MENLTHWETDDINNLLILLVGKHYGNNPLEQLKKIQQIKFHEAQNVVNALALSSDDTVIDLGSGCGFIAEHVSSRVKNLYCVDISRSFLDYAKKINSNHNNVDYYHIPFGDLSSVPPVSAIYSMAVFIHFNLYDIYIYLKSCYDCLVHTGRMLFDVLNDDMLDINSERWQRHSDRYFQDRQHIFTNLHYNNSSVIQKIAIKIGFHILWTKNENDHTFILIQK
jgi:SAM-dependent methyltransferase